MVSSFLLLFIVSFHAPSILVECLKLEQLASKNSVSDSPPQPITRVAIIGCGVAGLTLAHALENNVAQGQSSGVSTPSKIQTWLFDSRPSLDFQAGAGIQLNGVFAARPPSLLDGTLGMAAMKKINPKLHSAVASAALPLTHVRSRAKPWLEFGDNQHRPYSTLLELDLEQSVKQAGGIIEEALIIDGTAQFYTIMRGALQQVLFEELPPHVAKRTHFRMSLTGITHSDANQGIMCHFQNGNVEGPFDLVVGCDGIKSSVKQFIERGNISPDTKGGAIYSGIRIQYAVMDGKPQKDATVTSPKSAELRQYFGDGAYALVGTYGTGINRSPAQSAFVIFRDENYNGPFRRHSTAEKPIVPSRISENSDWTQDVRSFGDSKADFLTRIQQSGTPAEEIVPIVDFADRFFELGVYFHNPFSWRGWKRKVSPNIDRYCVLAGDAAHAMPPFLGQGANQAVQDAYSLASKVWEYNVNCENSARGDVNVKLLGEFLDEYEKRRWEKTTNISVKAAFLGYLETGSAGFLSKFRDTFFRFAGATGLARKIFLDGATPHY